MEAGSIRFEIGEFECVSVSDGSLNYPPESFFANVPLERVEEVLRERNLPTAQVMTPYTCLFINTGEHRVMVDTGAGDLGAHAADVFPGLDHSTSVTGLLPENLRAAGIRPLGIDTVIITPLLWASKGTSARHTINYDLINSRDPTSQISSVWRIPAVPMREKSHRRHPTQKSLRLVRRTVLASSAEGDLVFDPFCGSGTTGVAAKELGRSFVGAEKEREYAELAARRIGAERGVMLGDRWRPASGRSGRMPQARTYLSIASVSREQTWLTLRVAVKDGTNAG